MPIRRLFFPSVPAWPWAAPCSRRTRPSRIRGIQLSGGTGFDLVPEVQPSARIIFVTAYDRFALRAFEVNALDYLLKPVRPDRLAAAVQRLLAPGADAGPNSDTRETAELNVLGAREPVPVSRSYLGELEARLNGRS